MKFSLGFFTMSFAGLIFLGFACVSCTSKVGPSSGASIFNFRLPSEPPTIMPVRGIDNISIDVMNNILEGLFEFDVAMKPQPMLAERYTVSADGKTYHFYLRKNIQWSDGVPFRAQQIVDSWELVLSPRSQAEYAYFLFPLENAQDYHLGKILDFQKVGVQAVGDNELVVRLSKPLPYFLDLLAVVVTFPMRTDLYKKYGDAWTEPPHVVSLAPYILTKWNHDHEMVFEANPHYWGPPPKVTRVVARIIPDVTTALNLFEAKKLDLVRRLASVDVPRFEKDPRFFTTPYFRDYYIGFQISDPLVADVKIRQALALAIDRKALIKVLRNGPTETQSYIPKGMLGYSENVGLQFDPPRAKALWNSGKVDPHAQFKIYYDQRDDNKIIMELVQQQWHTTLGLDVELIPIEWKVYLSRMSTGLGPLFRYGWGADFPDPDNFMTVFLSRSGNNFTGWKNSNYDKLVLAAQHELKIETRVALYEKAQKLLLETDTVIVPLFTESLNFVLQPHWQKIQFDAMSNLFFKRIEPVAAPATR